MVKVTVLCVWFVLPLPVYAPCVTDRVYGEVR